MYIDNYKHNGVYTCNIGNLVRLFFRQSGRETPSSVESYYSYNGEADESPYPSSVKSEPVPTPFVRPGESLLKVVQPRQLKSEVVIPPFAEPGARHTAAARSPTRSRSAPVFSPKKLSINRKLPSPITTKDVDFSVHMRRESLSPMSIKCEDDMPEMQLSPMQSEHDIKEGDLKFSLEEGRGYDMVNIEPMCEL